MALGPENAALVEKLLARGIPVIACNSRGEPRQRGWSSFRVEDCDLSLYRPGDSIAMVTGHGLDVVDFDSKIEGATMDNLPRFQSFGEHQTPSGGRHFLIPSTGIAKMTLTTDKGPVGDFLGGCKDGSSRALCYLPGSQRSKYPGKAYTVVREWNIDAALDSVADPQLVAALVAAGAKTESDREVQPEDTSEERDPALGVHPLAKHELDQIHEQLEACTLLGWGGPPWNNTTFKMACNLVELANARWTGLDHDAAHDLLMQWAPRDEGFDDYTVQGCWDSATAKVHGGYRELPFDVWEEDEDEAPTEKVDSWARKVRQRAEQLRLEADARALFETERAGQTEISRPIVLRDFLAVPDEDVIYRVEGLWPAGGRILIAAQHKAGKTTMMGNLIRSLVDGDPFLGRFPVQRARRVVLVDDELNERMLRQWLREQEIVNVDSVAVLSLKGRLSSFNILDKSIRSRWAHALGGADCMIFDCLRPGLDALGLDEDHDAGQYLTALDELTAEAGIPDLGVVHHMGHNHERSRGSSRILDWPDAVWNIVRENESPTSPRYLSAYGRDVDLEEVALEYSDFGRRLTASEGNRTDAKVARLTVAVLEAVEENPGCSQRTILELVTGDDADVRSAIRLLVTQGRIRIERQGNSHRHYVVEIEEDLI